MEINQSERLSYGFVTDADDDLLFQLDQDPEVMRYINGGKVTSKQDVEKVFLPRIASFAAQEKGWGIWKVYITRTRQFIGWVLVRPMDFFSDSPQYNNLELGWRFSRDAWGKGYATEAARQVMSTMVSNTQVEKFCAIAMEGNSGSVNIMQKLGMQFIKKYRHQDPLFNMEVVYYESEVKR